MTAPAPHPLRFIIVRLAGRDFAIPASRVCGMVLRNTACLCAGEPGGPLRYALRLESRSIPVLLPHALLGLEERAASSRACLLLIRDPAGHDAPPPAGAGFAVAVDSVSRLEEIPPSFYRPPGRVRLGEAWRDVLDPDRLYRAALAEAASPVTK